MAPLSAGQIRDCVVAERVSASVSVTGILIMITAFYTFSRLHTLSNQLLIYASFANLGANAAALIGGSGLSRVNSPLCQAQAFLLEWLMQSDPLWGACMAFNVYLVIFRRWTVQQVRGVFKWYIPACYLIPLIPAVFCLGYKNKKHGRIYGDAVIWCWIDNDWADVRIYSYYGPVWIYLVITFAIYLRVGIEIFRKRSALRAFCSDGATRDGLNSGSASQTGNHTSQMTTMSIPQSAFTGMRTTDVEVTSIQNNLAVPTPISLRPSGGQQEGNFVDITANEKEEPCRRLRDVPQNWFRVFRRHLDGMDKIKMAYTKCALFFACSIVVTWVPSSANRVYGLTHASNPSFALNIAAAAALPLQGFWNSAIFFWTSWAIVELEYRDWRRVKAVQRARANSSMPQTNMTERSHHGLNIAHLGARRELEAGSMDEVLDDDTKATSAEYARNKTLDDDLIVNSTDSPCSNLVSDHATSSASR